MPPSRRAVAIIAALTSLDAILFAVASFFKHDAPSALGWAISEVFAVPAWILGFAIIGYLVVLVSKAMRT